MDKQDLIGKNSSIGLSEDLNGEFYTIWKPEAISKCTAHTVCEWIKTRCHGYLKCDGVTQSYSFDADKMTADLMREIDAALAVNIYV